MTSRRLRSNSHVRLAALCALLVFCGESIAASTTNLLSNPGAETGASPPWESGQGSPIVDNGTFNASIQPRTGKFAFAGGAGGTASFMQRVNLVGNQGIAIADIDSGKLRALVTYWHNALVQGASSDTSRVTLRFINSDGGLISTIAAPESDTGGIWTQFRAAVPIPVGTRSVDYLMEFILHAGNDNDSYIDDNVLEVGTSFGAGPVSGTFYWTSFGSANGYGRGHSTGTV